MSEQTLQQANAVLAETIGLTSVGDIKSLSDLYIRLQEAHKCAQSEGQDEAAKAAGSAAELVERIILQDTDSPEKTMEEVIGLVSAIDQLVRGSSGEEKAEAEIPEPEPVKEPEPAPEPAPEAAPEPEIAPEPEPAPGPAPEVAPITFDDEDKDLLENFVVEANDHLHIAEVQLLTLEKIPDDDEAVNAVFRAFHTIKGVAAFLSLDHIRMLAHETEDLLTKARKGQLLLKGEQIDVVFAAVDSMTRLVGFLSTALATGDPMSVDADLFQLIERIKQAMLNAPDPRSLEEQENQQEEVSPITAAPDEQYAVVFKDDEQDLRVSAEETTAEETKAETKTAEKAQAPAPEKKKQSSKSNGRSSQRTRKRESVKVDADRLDRLVDTIGELVIAESMVCQSQELEALCSPRLARQVRLLDKITRELQEMATSLRMKPIRVTFEKMARVVRDLAKKAGKNVRFIMSGEDTELDKSLVDRIGDPLIHMVRNAVDHGIEGPEARSTSGKNNVATVNLRAFHKGGSIYIELEDDGRGLDRDAILAKGRERGLVGADDELTDREVFQLIFHPGFSTAKKVTDVSGRGVGMDVVKREIDALRGQVDIRSERGKGTVFTIKLPLTLAIIDGMVVRVGEERYIIPTLSIVRSICAKEQDISTVTGKGEMFLLQGQLIPLFRMSKLFDVENSAVDLSEKLIVVVEDDARQTGLVIDELVGQQQIVIKSLGDSMQGIPGVAGGAIMPDGNVGLIVDVAGLVRLAHTSKQTIEHSGQMAIEECPPDAVVN